jgi:NAD(P)-dependent dehydrogenase (short-subunit alcohol dehydrogenase family)
MVPRPLAELTDAEFDQAWQQTMDAAVAACTEARTTFAGNGGAIVLTLPTTALAGGDHYAHWAAAAEGVHILTKSIARQWGPEGIAVNALAVSPELVLADAVIAGPVSIATPAVPDADPGAVVAAGGTFSYAHPGRSEVVAVPPAGSAARESICFICFHVDMFYMLIYVLYAYICLCICFYILVIC